MNYQREVVAMRQRRDAELERVRREARLERARNVAKLERVGSEAKRLMAEAVAARDAEIHRLRRENPSMGTGRSLCALAAARAPFRTCSILRRARRITGAAACTGVRGRRRGWRRDALAPGRTGAVEL